MTDLTRLDVDDVIRLASSDDAPDRVALIEACPRSGATTSALLAVKSDLPEMRPQAIDFLASTFAQKGPYDAAAKLGEATYRLARSMYEQGGGEHGTLRTIAGRGALNWMTAIKQLGQQERLLEEIEEPIDWLAGLGDADNVDMLRLKRVEAEMDLGLYDDAGAHLDEIAEGQLPPMIRISYRAHREALRMRVGGGTELASEKPVYSPDDLKKILGLQVSSDPRREITAEEGDRLRTVASGVIARLFGGDQGAVNEFTVRQQIIDASYLFTDPVKGRDPEEIAKIVPVLVAGRDWMRANNFPDSENDACWSLYLCYSRTGREELAARELQRLRANIEHARSQVADPNERARLATRYQYLYPSLATMLHAIGDTEGLFGAIEASKGRVLADLQTLRSGEPADEVAFSRSIRALPLLLERAGAAYVTYLVDDDVTFFVVVGPSGELSMHKIGLGREALTSLAAVGDPRQWGQRDPTTLQRNAVVGDELTPLVSFLADFDHGEAARHLCYSASGPLLVLPLHCARLAGEPIAKRFSVSRVHGAASLYPLLVREPTRPDVYLSVEVPAIQDLDDPDKIAALHAPGDWLQKNLRDGTRLQGEDADLDALRAQETRGRVIHFATHGTFPSVSEPGRDPNPYRSSGVVLAANGQLPDLNTIFDDSTYLLSPKEIVESGRDFTGSHVTLKGCVTGLAKPSAAGDALGLEFALLQLGAQSILSTHWNSNAISMAQFMKAFYQHWLVEKRSRAAAWRAAVDEAIARHGDTDEGAYHWAAFCLTGDWR
jgi:hypothetical protein